MELNQSNFGNSNSKVNKNLKVISRDNVEKLDYLYPNGHRITHQMRWFKGSRDRGLNSDLAAWKI